LLPQFSQPSGSRVRCELRQDAREVDRLFDTLSRRRFEKLPAFGRAISFSIGRPIPDPFRPHCHARILGRTDALRAAQRR